MDRPAVRRPTGPVADRAGKLGEYSDKSAPVIGFLAEYSDKAVKDLANAASKAEASMQLMEIEIASHIMKNIVLPGISLALEICPNLRPTVFWMKIRTRGPQPSICVRIFTQFTTCWPGWVNRATLPGSPRRRADLPRNGRWIWSGAGSSWVW